MKGLPSGRVGTGLYGPLVWATGFALAAGGVCLAILMLAAVIGPFLFLSSEAPPPAARAGLWLPPDRGAEARRRVDAWRSALGGDEAERLEARSLAQLVEDGAGVVVLPDARRLGGHDLAALRVWLEGGGGAVLAGAVSVRSADGEWLGFERMREVLGVDEVAALDAPASTRLAPARRGPLSAALSPDRALRLLAEPGAPALADPAAELRWPAAPAAAANAASKRMRVGAGRLAWLAFGPESAPRREGGEWEALAGVFRGAVSWAARRPEIELLPWPGGRSFAASLEETDAPAPDAATFEERLRSELALAAGGAGALRLELALRGLDDAERTRRRSLAAALAQEAGAWVAGPAARNAWSRSRGALRAAVVPVGPRRLRVDVTNRGAERVTEAALRLHLNREVARVGARGTTVFQALPRVRSPGPPAPGGGAPEEWVDLLLPELPARSDRAWVVDYREAGSLRNTATARSKP